MRPPGREVDSSEEGEKMELWVTAAFGERTGRGEELEVEIRERW